MQAKDVTNPRYASEYRMFRQLKDKAETEVNAEVSLAGEMAKALQEYAAHSDNYDPKTLERIYKIYDAKNPQDANDLAQQGLLIPKQFNRLDFIDKHIKDLKPGTATTIEKDG